MTSHRIALALILATTVAGCSSSSGTADVAGATVAANSATASVGGPAGGLSAGIATVQVAVPAPEDLAAQPLFGPWTLARSGDRVCTVDLGSRNAVGDFTAKTRRCSSVELARIALWKPLDDGLVLYDFERRPVVALRPTGPGAFEGALADGLRLTMWR
jgi:hypothetical protein